MSIYNRVILLMLSEDNAAICKEHREKAGLDGNVDLNVLDCSREKCNPDCPLK